MTQQETWETNAAASNTVLAELLRPERGLQRVTDHVLSALPADDPGDGAYDRRAATYDRLVGSRLYNRLVWGSSPRAYAAFAQRAVRAGEGPLLDVACGSAVFTASIYGESARPVVLADRSKGMLQRAAQRLERSEHPSPVLLQADLFDLPFVPASFTTVACHGALHLFEDLAGALGALRAQLAPQGTLYATSLVAETTIGRRWLALLHRAGEVAAPRRAMELLAAAQAELSDVTLHREGSMVFITARA
ncbi:MAG TPA: class I SAM-dependent methyltransferase [Solirubrobacteraceae bacterium]|nr:class I SAM-dependent methyltransferase [Solirubrobacteraceae bacterium]